MENVSDLIYMADVIGSIEATFHFVIMLGIISLLTLCVTLSIGFFDSFPKQQMKMISVALIVNLMVLIVAVTINVVLPDKKTIYATALLQLEEYQNESVDVVKNLLQRELYR